MDSWSHARLGSYKKCPKEILNFAKSQGQRNKRQLTSDYDEGRCRDNETLRDSMEDAIWANSIPPVLRRRRRDRQSDGASRSGATRPQNWIRWSLSLDAVSLTMGGAAKMEIMKIWETIITPDDLLTNINSNQSRRDWIASSANQNDNTRNPKNGRANSFDFHCQPFVIIGNYYDLFDDRWTCLAAGGQTVVFENSPSLESAQVSDVDFNNQLFKGDDYKRAKCRPVQWNGRPSVACPGKKTTFIQMPFAKTTNSSVSKTASTIFASLDGWLILVKVTPTAVGNIAR